MAVIRTRAVTTTDSSAGGHTYRSEYSEFNTKGLPLLEETWDASGQLTERYIKAYDDLGRLVKESLYQDEEEMAEERQLEYDAEGRLDKERRQYLDGSISVTSYSYDEQGRRLVAKCVDEEGEEESVEETAYRGNAKAWEKRTEYGEPVWSREWKEDEKGRIIRYRLEDHAEETLMEHEYLFDSDDRLSEERVYRNGRLIQIRRQTYDAEGRIVSVYNQNERGEETAAFEYDAQGRQLAQEVRDGDGNFLHEVLRTYDGEGNILTSAVRMTDPSTGAEHSYRLDYHYEYYPD